MAGSAISLPAYVALVRSNRNFRRLWLAQIVSEMGDWFYSLAIYALLLQFTGKAASVGIALVLQILPNALISPIAGAVNDRISRKRMMIISDITRAVIVSAMLLVRSPQMVWLVYPLLFLEAVMWTFFEPARSAVIPNITREDELLVANTLAATTWSMNLAIGAMLGGVVAAMLGTEAVFALNALSFVGSALLIGGMKFKEPHIDHSRRFQLRDLAGYSMIAEGVRYIAGDARLAITVFAKAGIGFAGTSWVLLTVMGQRLFPLTSVISDPRRAGILAMSVLMGARGVGSTLGPFVAAPWTAGHSNRLRLGILLGYVLDAAGYFSLSVAPNLLLASLAVLLAHAGGSMVWVFSTTLLQMYSEDRFRGRVFAAEFGLCMLVLSLAAYCAGVLLDHGISMRGVAMLTGVMMCFPALAWGSAIRWTKPAPVGAESSD